MKNQARKKPATEEKEDGNRLNSEHLTWQNELFYQVEASSVIPPFKLGKTEEEILIDLVRKLSISTDSPNTVRSLSNEIENK